MEEPPAHAIGDVTHYVNQVAEDAATDAVEDHEQRMHISPRLDDSQTCRAWELLSQGATLEEAAAAVDMPVPVVVRALSEDQRAWRQFLAEREASS